jgi:HEAT repeat protein
LITPGPGSPRETADPSVSLGIITLDPALVITGWNHRLTEWTGVPSAAAEGRPLVEVVPSVAERGLLGRLQETLATGQVQVLAPSFHHYFVPCPPVSPSAYFAQMQQRATLGPLDREGRVVGIIISLEDVTARLEAERRLAEAMQGGDAGAREAAVRTLAEAEHLADPAALSETLRDDSWKVRRAAVRGLVRHADRDTLVTLIQSLRSEHGDFNVLNSALQILAASQIDVTSSLAALIDDPDADLRMQAALALGQQERSGAVPPLLRLLDDPDVNVRFHAIEALGRLRAVEASERLADFATGEDFFLAFPAIDALAAIRDSRVAARLVSSLESRELSDAVAEALGELGEADVIPAMVGALNEGNGGLSIIRALARLHQRYERFGAGPYVMELVQRHLQPAGSARVLDALVHARPDDIGAVVLVMGWLRGEAVERALTRLLGREEVRAGVIEAVVRQGAGVVDLLIDRLEHADDEELRAAAIAALARIGDRRAVPALVRTLDDTRPLAVAAAAALASIGDASAFEPLLALIGHPDSAIRQAVIGALNSLGHPEMPVRICALIESEDAHVRESAVRIAGYFGYEACAAALVTRCQDPDEQVRRAAIEQLPNLDHVDATALLARALETDTAQVRVAAVKALGRLPDPHAVDLLLEAAADQDPWVRYFATRGLTATDRRVIDRLVELSRSDPAPPVRLAAIEGLASVNGVVFDALLAHVNGPDEALAAAALSSMGALDDERAVDVLVATARGEDAARRLAAVRGLARRPGSRRIDALTWVAGLDSSDNSARAAVDGLAGLARGRDASADEAIGALLALTADRHRREDALAALAEVRHRLPSVAAGLRSTDPEIRSATVEALSRQQQPEASAAIRTALDDEDPTVRHAAVVALHRLGARGLEHVFATLAREDPAPEVQRAAAAALGQHSGSGTGARASDG